MKKIIFIGIMVALLGVNSFAKTQKSTDIKGDNMGQKMLTRNEIADKYKWNMKDFYSDWNEWEKDFEKLKSTMKKIPEYRGKIKNNSKNFIELIKLEEQLSRLLDKLYIYVYMLKDINSKDEVASVKLQEIESVYTQYSVSTAWITPEILEIPQETMKKWIDENPEIEDYRFSMMEIYRLQGHVLDEPKEKLLSYYGQYMGAPSDIYGELSISDMKWNEVKLSDGYEGPVTNGIYSKVLSTNRNQEDRKKAFEALYGSFNNNKNTYGAIYRALLQRDVASAQGRNFKSTLERALEGKNVPVKVFQTLLQSAKDNNAPLQRYVKLRKKALNLKEYHYYDNSINIVEYNKKFDYDTAKDMVYKSVAPLGQDYSNKMNIALSEGWIDVFETENKRSGAYSIGVYDVHPFMLLNYQSTMDDVFTLAHELGHTLHTMLSSETQPYALHDYTIW